MNQTDWPTIERGTARSLAEAATDFQLSGAGTIGWVLLISINPSLLTEEMSGNESNSRNAFVL